MIVSTYVFRFLILLMIAFIIGLLLYASLDKVTQFRNLFVRDVVRNLINVAATCLISLIGVRLVFPELSATGVVLFVTVITIVHGGGMLIGHLAMREPEA